MSLHFRTKDSFPFFHIWIYILIILVSVGCPSKTPKVDLRTLSADPNVTSSKITISLATLEVRCNDGSECFEIFDKRDSIISHFRNQEEIDPAFIGYPYCTGEESPEGIEVLPSVPTVLLTSANEEIFFELNPETDTGIVYLARETEYFIQEEEGSYFLYNKIKPDIVFFPFPGKIDRDTIIIMAGSTCNEPPPLGGSGGDQFTHSSRGTHCFTGNCNPAGADILSITNDNNNLLFYSDGRTKTNLDTFLTISLLDLPSNMDFDSLYNFYGGTGCNGYDLKCTNQCCDTKINKAFTCLNNPVLEGHDFQSPLGVNSKIVMDVKHTVLHSDLSSFDGTPGRLTIALLKTQKTGKVFRLAFRPKSYLKEVLSLEYDVSKINTSASNTGTEINE